MRVVIFISSILFVVAAAAALPGEPAQAHGMSASTSVDAYGR